MESMSTRADIAHLGATGYELDSTDFSEEVKALITAQVAEYHEMESLVLEGDLYRTQSPLDSNFFGFMIVSQDKTDALLTVYKRLGGANADYTRLNVRGLDPDKYYHVSGINRTLKGSTLINSGLVASFPKNDFQTKKYRFTEVTL
jgi:alpha-galactosidase